MKKIYKKLIVAAATLIGFSSIAQVSAYSFTQTSGTYNAITGGTVYGATSSDDEFFVDPSVSLGGTVAIGVGLPIGFNFTYNGNNFDRFAIDNNGWISLGQSTLSTQVDITSTSQYAPISSVVANTPAILRNRIAALGLDLQGQTGSEIRVQTLGVSPNRTLVVQWSNYRRWNQTGHNLNFQIRLSETTNQVTVVYGTFTGNANSYTPQVGLGGIASSDYNNRNVTSTGNWSVSTNGVSSTATAYFINTLVPTSGQTYQWTPPPVCAGAPGANTALSSQSLVCPGVTTNLSLTNTYSVVGLSYQWQASTTGSIGAYSSISNATTAAYTASNNTVPTWFQCVITCTAVSMSSTSTPVFLNVGPPAAPNSVASATFLCSSLSSNLSLSASFTGINYQWLASTTASTGPYSAVTNATNSAYSATNITTSTWFQSVLSCTSSASASVASTPIQVTTAPSTTNTVPYNEGFEGIVNTNDLPNCSWVATDLPTICRTYTTNQASYNRIAHTGSKFASFRYGTNTAGDYFYTNGIQLNAGTTYSAAAYYITDGTAAWQQFSLLYGTSQSTTGLVSIASVTAGLTNTTYNLLSGLFTVPVSGVYYIAVKGRGTSSPWYLTWDDLSVTAPPVCFGAPAANTAVTSASAICPNGSANLSLANSYTQTSLTYQWFSAPAVSGPYTAISNATTSAYAATNLTATAFYQAVITCANGPASTTSTPVSVNVASVTINTPAYFESFEGVNNDNDLPNCSWSASDLPTICKTYTTAQATYNRIPNTGSKFASFRWGTNATGDYFYSNGLQLTAGTTYSASAYYIADGAGGWSEFSLLYGTSQSTTGLVNIATVNGITNTTYSLLANTFTVPTTGVYYIAVKAVGNSTPWYLSWDDLSVTAVPNCTTASGGTLSSTSFSACNGSTISLSSTGATIGSGINYQWQVSNTASGPYSNVVGGIGATGISYTTAALTTGTYFYVLQTTCVPASLTGISNEATVTINPVPTASASSNGPLCSGQTLNLTGSTNIGTNFMWTGPNSYTSSSQSPSFVTPLNSGGVYTLLASAAGCTSTPATVSVTVNSSPGTFSLTPPSPTICAGNSQTITASLPVNSSTLTFGTQANQNTASTGSAGYPGPYSAFYGGQRMQILILANELTAAGFVANSPLSSIQFPVVSKGANWGTSINDNQNFQVNIGSTTSGNLTSFQTGLTNVVAPMSFTPTVGYNNIHTFSSPYTWDGTSNIVIETTWSNNFSGVAADLVVSYNSPVTFTGTIVYRNDSQTAPAVASATTISYSYLSRPDFKLNGLAMGTYSWSPSTALSANNTQSVVASPLTSTNYTVTLANAACSTSAAVNVSVTPIPSVSIAATSTAVCAGSPSTLTASGATTYSWNTSATTTVISVSPSANTSYTVTGFNGTCTNTAVQSISVNPSPTVNATSSATLICNGSSAILTATGASTYSWNTTATTASISISPTVTTSYTVTGTTNGCSNTFVVSQAVSGCVGIDTKVASVSGILVYPNPNTGEFTIELNNGSVKNIDVMDLTGRVVISNTSSNDKVDFNINTLANGIYYVRIQSNNTVEVIKIVKQ